MDVLSVEELKQLIAIPAQLCVSLFMPTERGGVAAFQNPVRLRNLLGKAEQDLQQRGHEEAAIQALLQPAQALVDDLAFWEHPSEGLALFLSPERLRSYHLPLSFAEQIVIGQRFFIRPLLPLLSGNGRFYLLVLSQKSLRLLEGTRDTLRELALQGVPHSLAEALQYDESQAHQGTNYNAGRPFPGSNEPKEDRKEKIGRFFHLVDKALSHRIKNETAPLVLAGVDYERAIYRHVNTYSHLLEAGVEVNPERHSLQELQQQAWKVVAPYFQAARQQALAQYTDSLGTGLASNDVAETVLAASSGRVDSLFVVDGSLCWGLVDPRANRVVVHAEAEAGDEELGNLAAIETLLHSGSVFTAAPDALPPGASLAAVLRY